MKLNLVLFMAVSLMISMSATGQNSIEAANAERNQKFNKIEQYIVKFLDGKNFQVERVGNYTFTAKGKVNKESWFYSFSSKRAGEIEYRVTVSKRTDGIRIILVIPNKDYFVGTDGVYMDLYLSSYRLWHLFLNPDGSITTPPKEQALVSFDEIALEIGYFPMMDHTNPYNK